jgi:hypothetical protein
VDEYTTVAARKLAKPADTHLVDRCTEMFSALHATFSTEKKDRDNSAQYLCGPAEIVPPEFVEIAK